MPRTLAEHRERYFKNRKDAEEWGMVVTPAYEGTLEKLISGAAKLQPPHFRDDANQEAEAQILTLQRTRHVTSKMDGDRKLSDVSLLMRGAHGEGVAVLAHSEARACCG